MSKRTVIKADEELVIKGKLTVEGNVTQIETTQVVNRLESNSLVINSDGENVTAELTLNSDGTEATISFSNSSGVFNFNKPIDIGSFPLTTTGNVTGAFFHGNARFANGIVTGQITETANLWFTTARANSAMDAYLVGGAGLTYSSGTFAVGAGTGITVNADDIQVNSTYIKGLISVTDSGGDGSLSYNNTTGVFTFTGPSASEVRAHLSATDGIEYSNTTGIINLANTTGGAGLTFISGVLAVGAGSGITVNADNVAVDSSVVRTTGTQTIAGDKTFTGTTTVSADIVPSTANSINLGSWANHFGYVFANVLHAEYLDLEDANISDIHNTFYVNTNGALSYTHNSNGAYYAVTAGDGITTAANTVAVDSTVIRNTGDQSITGNISLTGNLLITGNLDVTANINSLTVVDLLVQDSTIVLNSNASTGADAYVKVERGGETDVYVKWDDTAEKWKFTNDGSNTYPIPVSTTDLIEGNNLYFTTGRVNSAVDAYIIGGPGLTYSSGTLTVGAGTGVIVNSNDVQVNADYIKNLISASNGVSYNSSTGALTVDSTVVRTTGDQSLAGIKNFTGELVIPSSLPTSNNTIYVNAGNTAVYAYVNGQHVQLTADSDVGQVEDVGTTGIDVYAGSRSVVVGNNTIYYHGIKSINAGNYLDISEASNVITVAGNATNIRGLISASGNISYNSNTGVISESLTTTDIDEGNRLYFTAARARGNISGTGLISYDSGTGVISTTADNYNNWNIQTDSGTGALHSVASNNTVLVQGGTGITVTNTGGNITISSTSSADITEVAAGNGLTGGGIAGSVTLNIGAGTGIIVNSDDIAVNATYIKGLISITDSGGDGSLSYDSANGIITYTGPNQAEANARMDAYLAGGNGLTYTSGTFAVGSGFGITVNADNIEISNSSIRSLFSVTSPLSYDSANGIISISEVGDISEVVAGSGLTGGGSTGSVTLNIGAGTGITVNADNVAVNMSAFSTTDLAEGANLYYTSARANSAMDAYLVGGSGLTYSSGTFNVGAGNYITVGANDVAVDATSTNTANKVVARDASGNFAANIITATATTARYADLAENYLADADYLPGTVLVFGGNQEVTLATTFESTKVAGVVTTQPAHVMNSDLVGPTVACIALRGRVPVLVKGIVRKGDVLVTAGEGHNGYAVASLDPRHVPAAAIIGKAIGDKLDAGPGVVEALI